MSIFKKGTIIITVIVHIFTETQTTTTTKRQ